MIIVYSFIGKLPKYIVDTVHQSRLFFDGDIYLILDELNSKHLKKLEKYNVKLINYNLVKDNDFNKVYRDYRNKFVEYASLGDRRMLFMRSIERFFLLNNLMSQKKLDDCLFMELDNLIYDNPCNWKNKLDKNNIGMMYDNDNRLSTGIMYVKNNTVLKPLLNHYIDYIKKDNGFLSEMKANFYFYKKNRDYLHFLPIHWKDENKPKLSWENYDSYNSIFDSAAIGIFLFGNDMIHTNGKLLKGIHNKWSKINYTNYNFIWKKDDKGRNRPYILKDNKYILVNNLHIHSKQLHLALSK
jgi:hypothetical protein